MFYWVGETLAIETNVSPGKKVKEGLYGSFCQKVWIETDSERQEMGMKRWNHSYQLYIIYMFINNSFISKEKPKNERKHEVVVNNSLFLTPELL